MQSNSSPPLRNLCDRRVTCNDPAISKGRRFTSGPGRRNTYDPPARRRHLGIRAPMAASPRPEGLPARRVYCRLTPVPLPRPIMCLRDPRSRPLWHALHSLENCPGSPQFCCSLQMSASHYATCCDRSSLHESGGPRTTDHMPSTPSGGSLGRPRGLALRLRARGGLGARPATLVVLPLPGARPSRRPSSSRLAPAARCHMVARRTLAPSPPDVGG